MPRDASFDLAPDLLRAPYEFIGDRCRHYGTDLFEGRLLLQRTIFMRGREAARLFYDQDRFMRGGAMPEPIRATLLGKGGVQGLDDAAHRHRKQMFMALMTPARIAQLGELTAAALRTEVERWARMEQVVLYDAMQEVLTRAVCAWCEVPLPEADVARRSRDLALMFDAAGAVSARHWQSRLARWRGEGWIAELVRQVRAGHLDPPAQSPLRAIALHRDLKGALLPRRIVAVELLNLLRPTVAIAVFLTFIAHALHRHPECRRRLEAGEAGYAEMFVQEVRRFYPFFPAVAARVRHGFEWQGYRFPRGRRVILDLYGTNHDPRSWEAPEEFRPERFLEWDGSPFNLIPQGGGDHDLGHRCAGEWVTIELMKVVTGFLVRHLAYEVPEQDLRIDMARLPALPRSGFVISRVRPQA
ncbi:cytochrome P450 [Siccirubricoccus sp. KC 17139]|uniref:Cytochrome P450 n=1 Tax=Siccirubricoccus soli TaxID=2899147 RepID=A0ABT1DC85_9PROT|nr:cytochrome P450 [Siccirubricoccus soli]MCO6419553.1 cytochrome P450 [Siccirubricoccus soli]MCP2685688.1 cytochrome P450 [Siccirubricoccus soli]